MNHKATLATAAAALLAGTVWVGAQTQLQIGTPDARSPAPGTLLAQRGEPKEAPKAAEPKGEPKAAQPKAEPKAQPKAAQPKAEPKAQPKAAQPKAEPKAQPKAAQPKAEPKAQPKAAEPKAEPKAAQPKAEPKAAEPTTTITSEQGTRIRETITKVSNAPRVTSVNFSLTVGTVVPRTVTVVVLPTTVVEIYPAWRGYLYFIVGDRIVIVEPGTLRIVMIIDA